jgi:hypothetical protein
LADTGSNTGITVAGNTGWKQHPKSTTSIYVDVDTKDCQYSTAPKYFTAISGFIVYWRAMGAHIIYFPKVESFRVYVVYDKPLTPTMAEGFKWAISWIGVDSKIDSYHQVRFLTAHLVCDEYRHSLLPHVIFVCGCT